MKTLMPSVSITFYSILHEVVREKDALKGHNAYTQYLKDNTMKTAPSGLFLVPTMELLKGMHHAEVIF